MFVLGIPDGLIRRHIACPESVVAIPMPGSSGLSGLLSDFLRGFWQQCRENLDPNVAPRMTHAILDLDGQRVHGVTSGAIQSFVALDGASDPHPELHRSSPSAIPI